MYLTISDSGCHLIQGLMIISVFYNLKECQPLDPWFSQVIPRIYSWIGEMPPHPTAPNPHPTPTLTLHPWTPLWLGSLHVIKHSICVLGWNNLVCPVPCCSRVSSVDNIMGISTRRSRCLMNHVCLSHNGGGVSNMLLVLTITFHCHYIIWGSMCYYHHCANLSDDIELMKCLSDIFCRVCEWD